MTTYNPDTLYFRVVCQVADLPTKRLDAVRYYLLWADNAKDYSEPQMVESSKSKLVLLCHLGNKVRIDPSDESRGQYFEDDIRKIVESNGWRLIRGAAITRMN